MSGWERVLGNLKRTGEIDSLRAQEIKEVEKSLKVLKDEEQQAKEAEKEAGKAIHLVDDLLEQVTACGLTRFSEELGTLKEAERGLLSGDLSPKEEAKQLKIAQETLTNLGPELMAHAQQCDIDELNALKKAQKLREKLLKMVLYEHSLVAKEVADELEYQQDIVVEADLESRAFSGREKNV